MRLDDGAPFYYFSNLRFGAELSFRPKKEWKGLRQTGHNRFLCGILARYEIGEHISELRLPRELPPAPAG